MTPHERRQRAEQVLQLVARHYSLSPDSLRARDRDRADKVRARQVAAYLLPILAGISPTRAGSLLARDRTTISYARRQIHEARATDPHLEAQLQEIAAQFGPAARLQLGEPAPGKAPPALLGVHAAIQARTDALLARLAQEIERDPFEILHRLEQLLDAPPAHASNSQPPATQGARH